MLQGLLYGLLLLIIILHDLQLSIWLKAKQGLRQFKAFKDENVRCRYDNFCVSVKKKRIIVLIFLNEDSSH